MYNDVVFNSSKNKMIKQISNEIIQRKIGRKILLNILI